jgi:hypothetical protein
MNPNQDSNVTKTDDLAENQSHTIAKEEGSKTMNGEVKSAVHPTVPKINITNSSEARNKADQNFLNVQTTTTHESLYSDEFDGDSVVYAPDISKDQLMDKIYGSHVYNQDASSIEVFPDKKTEKPKQGNVSQTEKVIGYTSRIGEERILSEDIEERDVKVMKRIVHQDNYEKIIVVTETELREELVEMVQKIKGKVVRFTRPVIREKLVENTTVHTQEVPVKVVEKVFQERIKHVPKIEHRQRVVQVPKYIVKESIVEVPQIEYKEVIKEKIVEVPEIKERYVIQPVPVPEYVEKPVPQEIVVDKIVEVERSIPQPLEVVSTAEYLLPQMAPKLQVVKYPLYVPRFTEVPVPAELFTKEEIQSMENLITRIQGLTGSPAIGLHDLEQLAESCRSSINMASARMTPENYEAALSEAWRNGQLNIENNTSFACKQ